MTITYLEQRTSEVVRTLVDDAREYVKTQSVVHMDETGWRGGNRRAWLWVYETHYERVGEGPWYR